MKLYYVTEALAGTSIWPAERGWYLQDEDDNKLYGPAQSTEGAVQMWTEQTGKKVESDR
jgi:hypothetical protein